MLSVLLGRCVPTLDHSELPVASHWLPTSIRIPRRAEQQSAALVLRCFAHQ